MTIRPVGPAAAPARAPLDGPVVPADRFTPSPARESLVPDEARARRGLAEHLARGLSRFCREEQVHDLFQRLEPLGLGAAEREAMGLLAEPLPTWRAEAWQAVPLKSGAQAWRSTGSPALLTSRDLSLEGLKGCLLEFEEGHSFASASSRCTVEVSRPGEGWRPLMEYRDEKPVGPQFLDLSPFDGSTVRLRFRAELEGPGEVWLEAFSISGTDPATGETRSLPLEFVMRVGALEDLLALAAALEPPDRAEVLGRLAALPPETRAQALPALAASPGKARELMERAVRGTLVGSPGGDMGGSSAIEVGESAVRVGSVLLDRR